MYALYDDDGEIIRYSEKYIKGSILIEDQVDLFGTTDGSSFVEFALNHWNNMPDFSFKNKGLIHTIQINFASEDDMREFSKLINKVVTYSTKSFYWPIIEQRRMEYVDEE
jgi:hypothetical protein